MTDQPPAPHHPHQPANPHPGVGQPPAPQMAPQTAANYTDGWGIASIILASLSLCLPGFVVGLIGASKAKRIGASPVLSRIGWIVNLAIMVIGLIIGVLIVGYAITHPGEFKSSMESGASQSASPATKSVSAKGYALNIPTAFSDNLADYPDADIAQGDGMTNIYVTSYSDKAADIAATATASDYADKAFQSFQADASFTGQTRSKLAAGTIPNPSNLDAIDYRLDANYGIKKYIYYERFIKTTKGYYMLSTWTTPADLDKNTDTIKQILSSFHEVNS